MKMKPRLMLATARRGNDRNYHYREHSQPDQKSDRGIHA
jgi:hypothetical protein